MAQKSNQNQPGRKAGSEPDRPSQRNEFDDAVTTEISDVLIKAFDEHPGEDPGDPFITDVSLTEYIDPENEEVLPPGFLLRDRFEIVELVYAAGMSHVYKAIDQLRHPESSGDIHVAIKIMRPSIVSNERARLSMEREAAISQSLSHPNIINIFDFDDHEGQFFLVMEWLDGESVNAMLRRTSGNGVAEDLAHKVIIGAATGVQHAHQHDIVHADVNPSNIFITDTQETKLLDFGVARVMSAPEQSDEDRFAWVTQSYASPEVLSGLPPVVEDDVFSLACVAYRLLRGRHPFGGRLSLVAKHKGLSVEPIPGLPESEWEILRRALSYERAERPASVDAFVTWGTDVVEEADHPDRLSMPERRTWLAALAAVVIVAGGFWLYQGGIVDRTTVPAETALPLETTVPATPITASEALVIAATQALDEGDLITPDEVSARALFRAALVLESDNAEALRGLRTISDDFVQQAQGELNNDNLTGAYAALTVALETDPANPSIEVTEQLVSAKGDGELADARLAIASGNLDLAVQKITRAEEYRHIESAVIEGVRQQIEESRQSILLTEQLNAADEQVAVVDDAPDVTAAPVAQDVAEAVETPEPQVIETDIPESLYAVPEVADTPEPQVADEQPDDALLLAAASQTPVLEKTTPEAAASAAEPEIRRLSLQELGITDYVAPKFPRRALRRNISGMVEVKFVVNTAGTTESIEVVHAEPGDVFSQSAINAIDRWRFESREEPVNAQITLRFDQE